MNLKNVEISENHLLSKAGGERPKLWIGTVHAFLKHQSLGGLPHQF